MGAAGTLCILGTVLIGGAWAAARRIGREAPRPGLAVYGDWVSLPAEAIRAGGNDFGRGRSGAHRLETHNSDGPQIDRPGAV